MSIHSGGRGPGHVSRLTNTSGGTPPVPGGSQLRVDGSFRLRVDGSKMLRT